MSELTAVHFNLSHTFSATDSSRRIVSMAVENGPTFQHRNPIEGEPLGYTVRLDTTVADGLVRFLNDRYGDGYPPVDRRVKSPSPHTLVAAAKGWMDPTKSDPNIDELYTWGLRLDPDEVFRLDVAAALQLPQGEVVGFAHPNPGSDGTLRVTRSMLMLGNAGAHISVSGRGGEPYVGYLAAALPASQVDRPDSRLVHIKDRPHQIGTDAWLQYVARESRISAGDLETVRAAYGSF